ncbi:methyltransferase [Bombilactobacillus folatiphilus]|uniref:Methyltransferase n=1 Tax=Bombilactobacillus folatiphilus TaxID=2923362 RepID=A0ABY4PA65_9LACO|nr:methyltransferase [Bombilactobacillus folatiphilus]UQS82416.1 methyltransferase [Bombilactobacillus folatiphilus]
MTEQYFTSNPTAAHHYQEFPFTLRQQSLNFVTDSGVFSKQTIDYGTRALLAAIDVAGLVAGPLLDLGCGYGPIGLTLAKETGRQVDMTDLNERALALARQNATNNQLMNVHIFTSDVYEQIAATNYAAIYTNPPFRAGKKVVSAMIQQASAHLSPKGQFWLVAQKKQGAKSYQQLMQASFGNAEIKQRDKGYYIINSVKTNN